MQWSPHRIVLLRFQRKGGKKKSYTGEEKHKHCIKYQMQHLVSIVFIIFSQCLADLFHSLYCKASCVLSDQWSFLSWEEVWLEKTQNAIMEYQAGNVWTCFSVWYLLKIVLSCRHKALLWSHSTQEIAQCLLPSYFGVLTIPAATFIQKIQATISSRIIRIYCRSAM